MRCGVDSAARLKDRLRDMKKSRCRVLTGLVSGTLGLAAVAQEPAAQTEPAKPAKSAKTEAAADDAMKAPENVAAAPAEAEKTESGLASIVLKKGTGTEKPNAVDTVSVHYSGWQSSDGMLFDSSISRGQPAEFPLNQVIKGWTEGLQLMTVGEKRRFWIPAELAYGETATRPGGPSGQLVFDVELLSIKKAPEAPKDLTAPADAVKTESGLAFKILKEGEGEESPVASDPVTFQFTGWKADGEFLATSVGQPQPPTDQLGNMQIKGWVEALKLMKKGETRRVWIPAALAFGEDAPEGAPQGDLIFDLELLDFGVPRDPNAPEDVEAAPADAKKTESGIAFKILKEGEGDASPKDGDSVDLFFSGWSAKGASIASNKDQPKPFSIPIGDVPIMGWKEVLKTMKIGESRRVWIPAELTFEGGAQQGAPEGPLTFDLELVGFKTPPPPPAVPEDVAGAPADAKKTESGLAYKVLKKGTGEKLLTENDTAKVHYTGWTTDGEMFDSSVPRGELFPVNLRGGVIQGWLEGLKLMVEGEKTRFWIPADLAYGEDPGQGRPGGMLVFDIEVFEVETKVPTPKIEAVTPPIRVEPLEKPQGEPAEEKE